VTALNTECDKLFSAVSEAQKVLDNTYIKHAMNEKRLQNVHLTTKDLDRSDMGCLKKNLHYMMVQCHIRELMDNSYEY